MRIGVPKEVKILEHRVGILPAGVRELTNDGHAVFVESNAGIGVGVSDDDYRTAGALVLGTAKEVFETAQLIVKVKEPQQEEYKMLRSDHVLFTYLHLAADPELA
ncbi:MAG TPA: alanine dehydrogenase, partial [Gammaproteobacteria bacterium]|nr:alanine dehydrogenase [Gammaproteobacteria bacterium]